MDHDIARNDILLYRTYILRSIMGVQDLFTSFMVKFRFNEHTLWKSMSFRLPGN